MEYFMKYIEGNVANSIRLVKQILFLHLFFFFFNSLNILACIEFQEC